MVDANRNCLPFGTISTKLFTTACAALLLPLLLTLPALSYGQDVKDIAPRLADAITKSGKKTVAVVDFTDLQGRVTEFGRFLAEEFSVDLANNAKGFDVIDRTNLKTLLQEHKLAATGIIDPQTARRVGEIAGVQVLVAGTVTPFGESVRLSVKVLDAETARVISGVTADVPRNKGVDELLARGIAEGDQPKAAGDQASNQPIDHKQQAYHGSIGVATQRDYRTAPVAIVSAVIAGGPADHAGIREGDTLTSIDGKAEPGPELFSDIAGRRPGTKINVGFLRNGQKEEATLTVGDHAEFFAEVTAEIGDILFSIQACRLTGAAGQCWGTVTNRGSREVNLAGNEGSSYLIDNSGKQSRIPNYWEQKAQIWFGSGGNGITLQPNLPISFSIKGEDLSTDATSVSLVLSINEGKTTVKNIRLWHR